MINPRRPVAALHERGEAPILTVVARLSDANIEAPQLRVALEAPDWVVRLNEAWEDVARRMELSIDFAALEGPDDAAPHRPPSLGFSPAANDEGAPAPAAMITIDPPAEPVAARDTIAPLDEPRQDVAPRIELPIELIDAHNRAA